MQEKEISIAVIKRLPRYYRYLKELIENDVVRISSKELSERMHVTASQIRQDFNNFGGFGQQGYGYNVAYLYKEIGKILGLDKEYNIIIIGAGNLGQALAHYPDFERRGFFIRAMFDINPDIIGQNIRGIPVYSMEELKKYLSENSVHIAALTIPKDRARAVARELVADGVKAIWNFAPTDLNLPNNIMVMNEHLEESLMRMSYNFKTANGGNGEVRSNGRAIPKN